MRKIGFTLWLVALWMSGTSGAVVSIQCPPGVTLPVGMAERLADREEAVRRQAWLDLAAVNVPLPIKGTIFALGIAGEDYPLRLLTTGLAGPLHRHGHACLNPLAALTAGMLEQ